MTAPLLGMVCPSCRVALVMSERQGVEIDYCPQCRGVWLDRGELDKIIERSGRDALPSAQPAVFAEPQHGNRRDDEYARSHGHRYPKRKKSFLEELFD
jgi:Zn-finger nucleic acid-binding protein